MRPKRIIKYTPLQVSWTDIVSDAAWHDRDEIEKADTAMIQTIGFFLQNKKKSLKLAHSVTDDGASDYTIIPWAVIKQIKELKHVSD